MTTNDIHPERMPKRTRLIMAGLLCLTGLGYFLYQHYRFSWPLIQVTPRGLAGLVAYELGDYRHAAGLWRTMAGQAYDPAALPDLVQAVSAAIKKDPKDLDNYLRLADMYVALGEYHHAATTYQHALQRNPELTDSEIGLATMWLLAGAYPEARVLLEAVFNQATAERHVTTFLNFLLALDVLVHAEGPPSADRYLTLAYAYRYLAIFDPRQYHTVIGYANRALRLDPNLDAAYLSAGVAYMKQGKFDLAIEQFSAAVRINPANAEAYKRLGYVYGRRGNPDQELAAYRRAVETAPGNPSYPYELGVVLLKKYGDLKQAHSYFRKAYDLNNEKYTYAMYLAHSLEKLKRHPEALAIYDAVVRAHPATAEAYQFQARCLVSLRRYAEAVAAFKQAEALAPLPFWSVRDLAFAYAKLDRMDEAIAAEEAALQRVSHDVETMYDLQSHYRRVGRYADAHRVVRQILAFQPDHPGALRVLPYLERNLQR